MLIRRMQQGDIPFVVEIEEQSFTDPWSANAFEESLACAEQMYFVAELENRIIGFIGMYLCGEDADIINVAVSESARKGGVGRQLVQMAKEEVERAGGCRIFLEVRTSNEPAIALYEKSGFVQVGMRKNYYKNPTEDARVMCWELSE